MNFGKTLAKFEIKMMNEHNVPNKGFFLADEAKALCNKIYDAYSRKGLPPTLFMGLAIHRSCITETHLDKRFIKAIGHFIH